MGPKWAKVKKSCQIPLILQICGGFDEIFLYVPKEEKNVLKYKFDFKKRGVCCIINDKYSVIDNFRQFVNR